MMKKLLLASFLFSTLLATAQQPEYILGRTTGELAALSYGLGTDRLGGAKITYIDSNVLVKIVDSTINFYKIQLGKNQHAYIAQGNVKKETVTVVKPYYLTGSWSVKGDSLFDYVSVGLDEKLPYQSFQVLNPSKIIVDIYGATNNTNWITQLNSAKEVKNVYYEQVNDDIYRVTIELKNQQHWGHTVYYNGNNLTVRIKRQPENLSLSNLRIVVDAGHGGSNVGTSGVKTKAVEKVYTLKIAKELEKALAAKGATVIMTRHNDTTFNTSDRILFANAVNPDLLISVHLNSAARASAKGISTYYKHVGFRSLTQHILNKTLETGIDEFGNIGSFNFALNSMTEYPNCLLEVAFLSNEEDEKRIIDPAFQKAIAEKTVEGIEAWLQSISEKKGF